MSKAGNDMIINHANRLHVCIADCRADELELPFPQSLAHHLRLRRVGGELLQVPPSILYRLTADEPPDEGVETAKLLLDSQKRLCILDGRHNLQLVADDPNVRQQGLYLSRIVTRYFLRIKPVEGCPVVLPLLEHSQPRESSLRSLEDEKLEESSIVVLGNPPLLF